MYAFAAQRKPADLNSRPPRRSLVVLDSVQIAQPCSADWAAMHAVEGFAYRRVRHCDSCNLRVYNLSAMPRTEAEALLRESEVACACAFIGATTAQC